MSNKGKLRIATGLGCLKAMEQVSSRLKEIEAPLFVQHGTGDRVCNFRGSEKLYAEASSADKEIKLYDGVGGLFAVLCSDTNLTMNLQYEHVLLRVGTDEKDDQRRQTVIGDMASNPLDLAARRPS
jgi:acylglycerol lipase